MSGPATRGNRGAPGRPNEAPAAGPVVPAKGRRWLLDEREVERLVGLDTRGARVLSVYLDLTPERQVRRRFRVVFDDLVREAAAGLDDDARRGLELEAERVRGFLDGELPAGRGVAIFSSRPIGLWSVHWLPLPPADTVRYEPSPYVRPLVREIDETDDYLIAIVDREKARLVAVRHGRIEDERVVESVVPGRHDQGGWSQANYQRHIDEHARAHLRDVAAHLDELARRRPADRLILAGPEEATTELRRLLPRPLAERVVATVPAETFQTTHDILARVETIERTVERETEERAVEQAIEAAHAAGDGTCGRRATLEAVWMAAVRRLLVAEGLELPGAVCPQCGWLEPARGSPCPRCGAPMDEVADLVELAVERVVDARGEVDFVAGPARERLIDECGGLAAHLRFRPGA